MFYGVIHEGFYKSDPDIYYNKDKIDNKLINLCFITGLGGSGKSTLSVELESKNPNSEHVEMDEMVFNFRTNDINLFHSSLIRDFFKTPIGRKYRKSKEELFSNKNYLPSITIDFINFAIQYSNKYKNKLFIIDGVYIYQFVDPDMIRDYAIFIKGTSAIISADRAATRDANNKHFDNEDEYNQYREKRLQQIKAHYVENSKKLKAFINKLLRSK